MTTLAEAEERTPNGNIPTGVMHKMNRKGDMNISWDKNDPRDVALAKNAWDHAHSRDGGRMIGYRVVGEDGKRGEVVREFDPNAERLILVPQIQGG